MARASKAIGGAIKLTVSLALIASALMAWQHATRANAAFRDPEAAYLRYPSSAQAATQAFVNALREDPAFVPGDRDLANIRQGLLMRPLSPTLLSFVAIRDEARGLPDQAEQAMVLAARISRRDLVSQVWLIERSVSKGDITAAMRHYHAVMSVKPEMVPVLAPIVAAALSYPEVRQAVRPYITRHAAWIPALLGKAAEVAAPQDVADLVAPVAASMASDGYGYPKSQIIAALVADGKSELAWKLAAAMMPGFKPAEFSAMAFAPASADSRMGALAWAFTQSGQISSAPPLEGALTVTISPLANGVVAVRDVPVVSGATYQFVQTIKYEAGTPQAQLAWTADCVKPQGVVHVWEQTLPGSTGKAVLRSLINVPADCHLLRMKATGRGAEGQVSSQISISDVKFEALASERDVYN